jgi:hypothetical protein
MAVLVTLLGVVIALLGLLVAGLLRSHAEILRALHDLGVDLDPARPDRVSGAVAAPVVRSKSASPLADRAAVDIAGETPDHDAVSIAVRGAQHLTLLAFLTTGCTTCHDFWDAFAKGSVRVPGDARLVVVTKGPAAESPASVRRLAPPSVPVVMSSDAWDAYDVPVAPFFVLVDGTSERVVGEGAAANWGQVTSMIAQALADAGLAGGKGRGKGGSVKFRSDARREERADRDLLAAGMKPGDPSLYPKQADDVDGGRGGRG